MNNYEKIKQMTVEQMAKFLKKHFDEYGEHFGCYSCTNYETHHYPDDCGKCEYLKCGGNIKKWLLQEVEE